MNQCILIFLFDRVALRMIQLIIAFSLSFLLCYMAMPSIIRITRARGIVDVPDFRKAHASVTPSFGGIGMFAGFSLVMMVMTPIENFIEFKYLMSALIVMFMVGARDDLDPLTPWAKLFGQLISVAFLVFFADVRLLSLYGLFGIYDLSPLISYGLSTIIFIFLINSFNLIDGIDGLCSSVSIFILSVLGGWFFAVDEYFYALLALCTAGSTLAFLKFNVSPSKIFMGDTGSLFLGTVCSVLVFRMLEINEGLGASTMAFSSGIAIAGGLLILPIFDTTRVFLIRIYKGQSPLLPDNNHIHHLLLKAGFSHMQATASLLGINVAFVIFAVEVKIANPTIFVFVVLLLALIMTYGLQVSIRYRSQGMMRTDP